MTWNSCARLRVRLRYCTKAVCLRKVASMTFRRTLEFNRCTSANNMLEIRRLNQFYGGSHTLWDIDMTVPTGSCTCLRGRNGMGKTTLLKCIMGLLRSSSGKVLYEGRDLLEFPAEDRA